LSHEALTLNCAKRSSDDAACWQAKGGVAITA
jgi:hypothetical protein